MNSVVSATVDWDTLNKNGDEYVCMKSYPHTPGSPAYLFNGTDNNAT